MALHLLVDAVQDFGGDQLKRLAVSEFFSLQVRMVSRNPDMPHLVGQHSPPLGRAKSGQESLVKGNHEALLGSLRGGQMRINRHDDDLDRMVDLQCLLEFMNRSLQLLDGDQWRFESLGQLSRYDDRGEKEGKKQANP